MPPERKSVRVTKKGHVGIPKEFREALGVVEGDILFASMEGDKVVLSRPGLPQPGQPVGPRSYDDLMKALEKERTGW